MSSPPNRRRTSYLAYTWKGEEYPSVTQIIKGGIPSFALTNWQIKMVAEAACDHASELATLVERDRDSALEMLKNAPRSKANKAAKLGSAIHDAIEALVQGLPIRVPSEEAKPYLEAFLRFVDDVKPEFVASEASVYNKAFLYAGTLDGIAIIDGQMTMIDAKTGKNVYADAALQLAAYRHAEFVGLKNGNEIPVPPTDGAAVLHLGPGTYELIPVDASQRSFDHFCAAYAIWRWTREGQAALGAAIHSFPPPTGRSPVFTPRLVAGGGHRER
jgi:hypothetical protein